LKKKEEKVQLIKV